MAPIPLVLLPGLDGTGDLFAPLVATAPPHIEPIVVPLPRHLSAYGELLNAIRPHIPASGSFAILGDSFSGPLAVAIARETKDRVLAVILSNTFVSPPRLRLLRFLPWSLVFLVRPPRWAIRWFFVGRRASPELVSTVRAAIVGMPARVLAARMRAVFSLPKAGALPPLDIPALLLTGTQDILVPPNRSAQDHISTNVVRRQVVAPHLLLQAAPAEAWAAILKFLDPLLAGPQS